MSDDAGVSDEEQQAMRGLSEIIGEEHAVRRIVNRIHEAAASHFRRHEDGNADLLRTLATLIEDEEWKSREPRAKKVVDECRRWSPHLPYRSK